MSDIEFASTIANAIADHAPLPAFEDERSLAEAYALQHQVTKARCGDGVGGIKAGVTAAMPQKFLGLDHALIGSLYGDARLANGAQFAALPGRTIECEVAVGTDTNGTLLWIAPAVEIVVVNFSRPTDMKAANLVACNLGADLFLVGDRVPWDEAFNDITATLSRGDEVLNEASMTDALAGPVPGIRWMWNEAIKRGFALGDETLFMMGACGTPVPASEGHYKVEYGPLGQLHFEVAPTH